MNPNYTAHEQQIESEIDQERYERLRHITEPGPRIERIPLPEIILAQRKEAIRRMKEGGS